MVDLIIGLQRKFGISLRENDEVKKVRTIGDLCVFFEEFQAQRQGRPQAAPEAVGRN